jgi:hypothetical protein
MLEYFPLFFHKNYRNSTIYNRLVETGESRKKTLQYAIYQQLVKELMSKVLSMKNARLLYDMYFEVANLRLGRSGDNRGLLFL